jgi:hypothetical protein
LESRKDDKIHEIRGVLYNARADGREHCEGVEIMLFCRVLPREINFDGEDPPRLHGLGPILCGATPLKPVPPSHST